MTPLLLCAIAYLLGSIPFGLILTRVAGLGDIRQTGSGNIGATNVLRTGNKKIAGLTLLLDMVKGFAAVTIALLLLPPAMNIHHDPIPSREVYLVAMAALLGHIYPVWLKFQGGKGVATYFGVLMALSPITCLIALSNWLGMFYVRRISSLSALVAALFVPLWLYLFTDLNGMFFGMLAGTLIAYTHRANIDRLMSGTELPFSSKKEKE